MHFLVQIIPRHASCQFGSITIVNVGPEEEIQLVTCTPTIQIVGKKDLSKKDLPKIMNDVNLSMFTSEEK